MDFQAILSQSPALALVVIAIAGGGWLERIRKDGLQLNVRIHPDDLSKLAGELGKVIADKLTTKKEPTCGEP